jgi:hypothetical protein
MNINWNDLIKRTMGARIIKGKTWPEDTKTTSDVAENSRDRWPEFPREDRRDIDSEKKSLGDGSDKKGHGSLGSNEFDENRDWGQRGQSHSGYQGGYGNGYGQQERGARGQHSGYYGSSAPIIEESKAKPRARVSKAKREGYTDSDLRTSKSKSTSVAIERSTSSKPGKESKVILNEDKTSSRAGTRSRSSRNRARSTANRGKH